MNQKRQRFIEAYVGEAQGNATKAAQLAGYSANTARQIGSRLLSYVDVKQAVEERQHAIATRSEMSVARIVQELESVATADVKVSSSDKMKALELLGKHRKMWNDKADQAGAKIVVNIGYLHTSAMPSPDPPSITVHAIEAPPQK